jgi:hypothetical protein
VWASLSDALSFFWYNQRMYYRRKVMLALLQKAGGDLSALRLQKLLFLVTRQQGAPSYHFVPYLYGSFSFESYEDMRALVKHQVVKEGEKGWSLDSKEDFLGSLKIEDRQLVWQVVESFRDLSDDELTRHTYKLYPFFAIRSTIAEHLLNKEELAAVEAAKPKQTGRELFTLGYEGLSIEAYLLKLLENNVSVLCDVRRNAMSMKYGFAKSTLSRNCEKMGIQYIHIPELGIESGLRKELKTRQDYMDLFADYEVQTLPKTKAEQASIVELLASKRRLALTCFEADPTLCHRSRVADALVQTPGWEPQLSHL